MALRQAGHDLVNFNRILAAPSFPKDGSTSQTMQVLLPGRKFPNHVTADWQPFLIGKDGKFRAYFGNETDKDTEGLPDIREKIRRYIAIDEQQLPKKLYGVPYFYYPFVAPDEPRMRSMLNLVYELTDGKGHPRFIFNTFPVYNSDETPPPPDGSFFRSTWKRAWKTDFRMDEI